MMVIGCRTNNGPRGIWWENLVHFSAGDPGIKVAQRTLDLDSDSYDAVRFTDGGDRAKWTEFKKALAEAQGGNDV